MHRIELERQGNFAKYTEVNIKKHTTDRVLSQEKYVLKKQGSFPSTTL
jgi:hypothetical protein